MTRPRGSAAGRAKGTATTRARARDHFATVAPVVRALRDQGLAYQAIADALNAAGYRTRQGGDYYPSHVQRVLRLA